MGGQELGERSALPLPESDERHLGVTISQFARQSLQLADRIPE